METMWIEILAIHIRDSVPRPGAENFGLSFYRGERRKIDQERGEEFVAKGAAREIEDPSNSVPRPSVRLNIQNVQYTPKEVKHG